MLESMLSALEWIAGFFSGESGTFREWTVDAISYFIQAGTVAAIQAQMWLMGLAWDIAKDILDDLNFMGQVTMALSNLPPMAQGIIYFFKIPDFLNTIATAGVTKYVMRFMGWL